MTEAQEARLKRLQMRADRRGTKEMDLIMGPFARAHLGEMSDAELSGFDRLLGENDQDLYDWVIGRAPPPETHRALIARIAAFLPS